MICRGRPVGEEPSVARPVEKVKKGGMGSREKNDIENIRGSRIKGRRRKR